MIRTQSCTGSKVTWDLYPGKETLNWPAVSPDGALFLSGAYYMKSHERHALVVKVLPAGPG